MNMVERTYAAGSCDDNYGLYNGIDESALQLAIRHAACSFTEAVMLSLGNMHLDNNYHVNMDSPFSEGETEMAMQRKKVMVAHDSYGMPVYKWVQGKNANNLYDNVVRAYCESGRIWEFMPKPFSKQTAQPLETGMMFREYAEKWLALYKENKVKPTTLSGYRSMLKAHLYPAFGERLISEITTADVQHFLNERKELARKTLHTMLVFLGEIFKDALEDKVISSNPTDSRRITIPSDKQTEREALSLEQVQAVIAGIEKLQNDDRRMMSLLLFTGMRRGEVLGLQWEDIDFEAGLIHVKRNVTYAENQPHIGTPKTKKGTRAIPLDDNLRELLKPYQPSGFIIGGEAPISRMSYRRRWERIEKQVDLHGATAHIFRHSYLTLAAGVGTDVKTLQTIAGHADIQITMNRYVHAQTGNIIEAGKKMSSLLNRGTFAEICAEDEPQKSE